MRAGAQFEAAILWNLVDFCESPHLLQSNRVIRLIVSFLIFADGIKASFIQM